MFGMIPSAVTYKLRSDNTNAVYSRTLQILLTAIQYKEAFYLQKMSCFMISLNSLVLLPHTSFFQTLNGKCLITFFAARVTFIVSEKYSWVNSSVEFTLSPEEIFEALVVTFWISGREIHIFDYISSQKLN